MTAIARLNSGSRTRIAANTVTTTAAATHDDLDPAQRGAVEPGRLPDQRDRADVARIDELGARRPPARPGRSRATAGSPPTRRLTATIASPATTAASEHPGLRPAALAPRPQRDPQQQRRRVELGDRDDGDRDAARDLRPPGRAGQRGQQERAVGQRVPGVEVAEQHGDRERQARAARRRSPRTAIGSGGLARATRQPSRDAGRTRASRRSPHSTSTTPSGSHDDQRHRLRDRRRVRVEQLDGVGRRARRASPGRTGSGRRGRAARPRAAARGRSPPWAARSATASSRSTRCRATRRRRRRPRGRGCRRADAVARGARRTPSMRSSRRARYARPGPSRDAIGRGSRVADSYPREMARARC